MVAASDLIGAWRLADWAIEYSDGRPTTYPFGEQPDGQLMYSADGRMSGTICRRERQRMSNENVRQAPMAEKAAAFDSYFQYAGTWRIDGDRVIHTVEQSLNPNFVGTHQVRDMDYSGDQLVLSARQRTASGAEMHNKLVWRRVGQ